MDLRRAEQKDYKQIQRIAKLTWNHTYEGIIPIDIQERFLAAAYSDESLEKRFSSSLFLVAEEGSEVVGFANYSGVNEEGTATLYAIYILPAYQGNKIGTALLAEGLKNLSGLKYLFVDVEKENHSGMHFYRAKGFGKMKEYTEDLYGHQLQTVKMRLTFGI